MRTEAEFEAALAAIAAGASPRDCGVPRTTLQERARRDPAFAGRLAAARQTARLRPIAGIASDDPIDRDELLRILSRMAREGSIPACRILLEQLPPADVPARVTLADLRARRALREDS